MPHPFAPDSDDLIRDHNGPAPDGLQIRDRQRSVCPAGPGHYRRPDLLHPSHDLCGSCCISADLSPPHSTERGTHSRGGTIMRARRQYVFAVLLIAIAITVKPSWGQTPQPLTLQQAEQIAIQNHPQIQAATQLASVAAAQILEARSIYYPQVSGSLTGAEAENNSRIAAGLLNNPVIYDRFD